MTFRVLDPRQFAEGEAVSLAPPLAAFEGAVIGLLDNAKIGTAQLYDHLEEILRGRLKVREVIRRRKPDSSRPAPANILGELSAADATVSGIGGWGSGSSCSMDDALAPESRGSPAVAIITDRFEPTARAMAELNGVGDYPFAIITHPIANDRDADLRAKAEAVALRMVPLLTRRS